MDLYYFYNLVIQSDIDLYGLSNYKYTQNTIPDVVVNIIDSLPKDISAKTNKGIVAEHSTNYAWFYCYAGCFIIENGRSIHVYPKEGINNNELSGFILGWGLSFIFLEKGYTAIHSSALSFKHGVFLISGQSGVGKSTLSSYLLEHGYKYLTDDITYVSPDTDYVVSSGIPIQKICREDTLKIPQKELLIYTDSKKDKYAYINIKDFEQNPARLKVLFLIEISPNEHLEFIELSGPDKLTAILDSLYMKNMFKYTHFPIEEKIRCLKIASVIKIIKIRRPATRNTINEICKYIQQYLEVNICQL
jgi:hypothetical protein